VLFFDRFFRKPKVYQLDLDEVRRRVHGIRELSGPSPSLVDLFSLVGENDVMRPPRSFKDQPPEPARVTPDQVPSTGVYQWER
jgi:hypothetical protein